MPELPEVETVRRVIGPQVAGRTIVGVDVRHPAVVARPSAGELAAELCGQRIEGLGRRGKFLVFSLGTGDALVLHLRMTGQVLVTPDDYPEKRWTHLVMQLDDGTQLRYLDQRRFGRFWLVRAGETDDFTGIAKLGPEPFDPIVSGSYLLGRLGRRTVPIKAALLDQRVVAGIGNIYASEICFEARVDPRKPCDEVNRAEYRRLAVAIPHVMDWAIRDNAITPSEYLAGEGRDYRNTPSLKVYGQEGEPCRRCGEPLRNTVLEGRSSYWCPVCQKRGSKRR